MSWEKIISKKFIGKGTFGTVYKVTNEKGAIGALKIIDKQYHKFRIQFKSAFEITRKINDINYVKAYQWLSDKDVSWVMEYIDGKPISSLKFYDEDSLDKILKTMIQVCNGLMALHSRNIIHRDLKPQNILLNSNNIAKITDFDFIKIEQTGTQISQFVGTPVYASPEHFISSYDLDIRSDLYSLGVILYELATGKLLFEGKDAKEIGDKHRLKPIILPTKINPLIPKGVERIITGLLEKNPKDRYQHAHTVAMDLFKEIRNTKGVKIKADIPYLLKPKFVNREMSFNTLSDLFNKLEKKQGKVVLILGESGIGKSKLIQHFYYFMQLSDVNYYYSICKTVEYSYEPFSSIFTDILANKTENEKLNLFGNFGWDLVKFGILEEKEWMHKITKPVEMSGKNAEIRLFSAMTNFIQKAAAKPLVICFDDLQWADDVILKWLVYAERNLKDFPVLIVGLHRTEHLVEDSTVFKIENLIRIRIKNLKDINVSEMIKSMLGHKSSNKELNSFINSIVSHSKGNPLFIREILYYLQEKGKITVENNKWSFPLNLELKNLPSDIYRIIRERLHELSNQTLMTLQTASIIGRKFSYEMLLNMTGKSEEELLNDLIDCREVSLIEESGNDYIFIHDKVRE
ncbi:MAG: protein kinase, partial [Candidatus Cloacimonetes bacterium]|nr:protein kinase [Candidatus Cloacimonadota bacterium]